MLGSSNVVADFALSLTPVTVLKNTPSSFSKNGHSWETLFKKHSMKCKAILDLWHRGKCDNRDALKNEEQVLLQLGHIFVLNEISFKTHHRKSVNQPMLS